MDTSAARRRLFVHAGFELDDAHPGILQRLRPYVGVTESDIADVIESLVAMHAAVVATESIDRRLAAALWEICHFVRVLAVRPNSAIRRNRLADSATLDWLENWTDAIERFSVRMLNGSELSFCLTRVADLIAQGHVAHPAEFQFLLPALRDMSKDEEDGLAEMAVQAIGRLVAN
jgi:hypothetical protein